MALTEERELNEILIRIKGGVLKGAHAIYEEGVKKDGAWLSSTVSPAIPLSLVDAADKPTLAAALGEATAALIAAKEAAEAEAAALRAEAAAKDANIQALLAEVEALRAAEKA